MAALRPVIRSGAQCVRRFLMNRWKSRAILCMTALLCAVTPVFANHIPVAPDGVVELETHGRLFVDLDKLDPFVEVAGRWEDKDFQFRYRAVTLGAYYRVLDNLKVGAFYRLQAGARHDDDWIEPQVGVWEWVDSRDRYENVLILDASPRFLLKQLPGENWVVMVKNRYQFNTYNMQQSLMVRPALTYFWMRERKPVLNITASYEAVFSVNYGDSLFYYRAPYIEFLYHLSDQWKLDTRIARKTVTWSSSDDTVANGDSYEVDYTAWQVSLGFVYMYSP